MATSFRKTFSPSPKMWAKPLAYLLVQIKKRTQGGVDRDGKLFPPYSPDYAKKKRAGFKDRNGEDVLYKGLSLDRQTDPPNFRLRGFTLDSLRKIAQSTKQLIIGWIGEAGSIVSKHERKGKYKVGGVTPKELEKVNDLLNEHFVASWNKQKRVVTIGKR